MKKIGKQPVIKISKRISRKIKCNVSIASSEIMLNRIFNGSKFEFPFSNS